jgi:hypothetical protein
LLGKVIQSSLRAMRTKSLMTKLGRSSLNYCSFHLFCDNFFVFSFSLPPRGGGKNACSEWIGCLCGDSSCWTGCGMCYRLAKLKGENKYTSSFFVQVTFDQDYKHKLPDRVSSFAPGRIMCHAHSSYSTCWCGDRILFRGIFWTISDDSQSWHVWLDEELGQRSKRKSHKKNHIS